MGGDEGSPCVRRPEEDFRDLALSVSTILPWQSISRWTRTYAGSQHAPEILLAWPQPPQCYGYGYTHEYAGWTQVLQTWTLVLMLAPCRRLNETIFHSVPCQWCYSERFRWYSSVMSILACSLYFQLAVEDASSCFFTPGTTPGAYCYASPPWQALIPLEL